MAFPTYWPQSGKSYNMCMTTQYICSALSFTGTVLESKIPHFSKCDAYPILHNLLGKSVNMAIIVYPMQKSINIYE